MSIGVEQQIAVVEGLIEDFRWARDTPWPAHSERRTYEVLKVIASDLRARLPGAAPEAAHELQRRIDSVRRSKTSLGYDAGALRGVGEELLGRWPVVSRALSRIEETEAEREIYSMMAHDVAAPAIVAELRRRFPDVIRRWEASNNGGEQ